VRPPEPWHYRQPVPGPAEIYASGADGEIACRTNNDVGIVRHEVSLPLLEDTRLGWSWRVDELPSAVREDTLPSHDYMSIAVEFDNGQDLTYYWSAELPPGTVYTCPLPHWCERETHVVVRSGPDGLGEWQSEERDLRADYEAALGAPLPGRVVAVWLIAVGLFQHVKGSCVYGSIEVSGGGERVALN
jgi:hypothetical protein